MKWYVNAPCWCAGPYPTRVEAEEVAVAMQAVDRAGHEFTVDTVRGFHPKVRREVAGHGAA